MILMIIRRIKKMNVDFLQEKQTVKGFEDAKEPARLVSRSVCGFVV